MAQFKQWFSQDFSEDIVVRHCESVMFTGDDKGAVVGVRLYDNGAAYSGGGTVTGAVKRIDSGLVALTGTLSGNAASVVIPAAALAYPGPIGVHIILAQGGSTTTILKAIYSVDDNNGSAIDPGTIIPSINDLITAINNAVASIPSDYSALLHTLAPDFSASTAYSAGNYVWYNGTLYRFTANHAAGSWTGADAVAAVVGNDLRDCRNAISTYVVHSEPYVVSIANYPDLNDLPVNSFMQFTTFNGVLHAPVAKPGYILSLSAKEGKAYGVFQLLLDTQSGWLYTRFKWAAQAYTEWYAIARNVEMYAIAEKLDNFLSPYVEGFKNKIQDKYLLPNGASIGTAADYAVTPFIPANPGECWVYEGRQNGGGLPNIVAYSDNNFSNPQILSFGAVNGRVIVFIPSGAKYVRAQAMTNYADRQPKFYHEHNVIYYDTNQSQSLRAYISAHITDASADNRYTVRLFAGNYDMGADFTSAELANTSFNGFKIPDYVSLEGVNGPEKTKLYCTVASEKISTINLGLCNNLKGLRITGENCRYAVHDDFGANDDGNTRIIEDCIIEAMNCSYGYAYGAGCRSGQKFIYKNTSFIGNNYEDRGYLMHSNTDFNSPVILEFFNCKFQSLNGHPERGFTLRALSNVQILNKCYINNSYCTGYELVVSNYNIVDWTIEGSANNKNVPVSTNNENFNLSFYDT